MQRHLALSLPFIMCLACSEDGGSPPGQVGDGDTSPELDGGGDPGDGDATSGGDGDQADSGGDDGGDGDDGGQPRSDADASLDDVDLTLGGLNQDLPPPDHDCSQVIHPSLGCVSFTGEYNGEAFAGMCESGMTGGGSPRNIECRVSIAAGVAVGEFRVILYLAQSLVTPVPQAFEFYRPPVLDRSSDVDLKMGVRSFQNDSEKAQLSHDHQAAIAGISYYGPGWNKERTSEFERGVFAATSTPKNGCVPDAKGFGCDSVRIRGTFGARTVAYID